MNRMIPALTAALLTAPAFAQFDFAPTQHLTVGSQPGGVATGDFDGDGDIDLATGLRFPDRVLILLNDGAGGFTARTVDSVSESLGARGSRGG